MTDTKSELFSEMSRAFSAAVNDLIDLAQRRLQDLPRSRAEQIVTDAMFKRPLRLGLLARPHPIDPAILSIWLAEARQ